MSRELSQKRVVNFMKINREGEDNHTIHILQRIGSPTGTNQVNFGNPLASFKDIHKEFECAWANRIGLLYLLSIPEQKLPMDLLAKRMNLQERESKTLNVVSRISLALQEGGFRHVIFKSIRPFPFTPNDTDVLILEPPKRFGEVTCYLLDYGYKLLGYAPLQTLLYDPAGEGKVNIKKDGGIYYIDLYRSAGSDYFIYLDSRYATTQLNFVRIFDVEIPLLCPELELAVLLYHNVFPENTYHLEHFYLIMYYLYGKQKIDTLEFVKQVRRNHFVIPVRANLSITSRLHEMAFGYAPERLIEILDIIGKDVLGVQQLERHNYRIPYYFHPRTFICSALAKLVEWPSFRSLFVQGFYMLRPRFMRNALLALLKRIKGYGVYEQK